MQTVTLTVKKVIGKKAIRAEVIDNGTTLTIKYAKGKYTREHCDRINEELKAKGFRPVVYREKRMGQVSSFLVIDLL